jgi:hypothetical protein
MVAVRDAQNRAGAVLRVSAETRARLTVAIR